MAINPNTNFSAGAILSADQMNRFPRGVMAYNQVTSNTSITTEAVVITGSNFTAVANRYYRITYFEPNPSGGTGYWRWAIRLTSISGAILNTGFHTGGSGVERTGLVVWVGTLTAGTTKVVATASMSAGTGTMARAATYPAFLCVEDIGPA